MKIVGAALLTLFLAEFFTVNAKQSYIPIDWIKADPTFWKSNPAAAAKPAQPSDQ